MITTDQELLMNFKNCEWSKSLIWFPGWREGGRKGLGIAEARECGTKLFIVYFFLFFCLGQGQGVQNYTVSKSDQSVWTGKLSHQ